MQELISINGLQFAPGQSGEINFNIARLPTHTKIELSVLIFRAPRPGPVLLLTAAIHGDETNGIEIIRRMIVNKSIVPECGTVIAVPIVNVYSFIQNARKFPDGKDMNRSFPGSDSGSLAKRIAYVLERQILPSAQYVIDFHTGGQSKVNYPHVRCDLSNPEVAKFARAFSAPFIVNSKAPDHSFRKIATSKGKVVLTYEGGESLRFDEHAISEGVAGTLRAMASLGMKKEPQGPPKEPIILTTSWWNRAKSSGLFSSNAVLGAKTSRGEVLGYISDPFGETTTTIKAASSGYIIGINNLCVVSKGDALVHLGKS